MFLKRLGSRLVSWHKRLGLVSVSSCNVSFTSLLIHTVRSTQPAEISRRSSKELWSSFKATSNGVLRSRRLLQHILTNIEQASRYFAEVSHSPEYSADDVYAFQRDIYTTNPDNVGHSIWVEEWLCRSVIEKYEA